MANQTWNIIMGFVIPIVLGVMTMSIIPGLSGVNDKLIRTLVGVGAVVGFYFLLKFLKWELIRKLLEYREWMYDHYSFKTKAWGILLKLLIPKKVKLFQLEKYLPKYPLPKLDDTCAKTLTMVKPLLSDEEFKKVSETMEEFRNNEGPKLQKVLEKRYDETENWLAELWNKYLYLGSRGPLPVHSNYCCLGDRAFQYNDPRSNQLSQMANCIYYFMEYMGKINNGSLAGMMIQDIVPICCDRYRYLCATTRIPGETIDEMKTFPNSTHVIVFRKGLMYKLDLKVLDSDGKRTFLTPTEIQGQLKVIMEDADLMGSKVEGEIPNPAIFTTTERTRWAKIRNRMLVNRTNMESLNIVESSAFCFVLSEDTPQSHSEEFTSYLTGNGYDRWFDKSFTFVVNKNGAMGFNVEHSTSEATLGGRMWEYTLFHGKYDIHGDPVDPRPPTHPTLHDPRQLKWELTEFEDEISEIKTEWDKLATNVDACVFYMNKGKGIVKKMKLSPDGFLQMALQLAFYRERKITPKTYETAATRLFKYGRTETIRPVSQHSVAFTKCFDDPSVPDSVKIKHLKSAIKYQTTYKFDATNGRAVDRHLLGLYFAGKFTGNVPELFKLKPFYESDLLSTSQSPLRYDPVIRKISTTDPIGGGFGAQRVDGYGVSYFMLENKVHFLISSFKSCSETNSLKFGQNVERAVDDLQVLLTGENQQKPNKEINGSVGKGDK
ncbi:carnitine O-palmitoyltransferase 1, liver isoform [Ciona intestinalis]